MDTTPATSTGSSLQDVMGEAIAAYQQNHEPPDAEDVGRGDAGDDLAGGKVTTADQPTGVDTQPEPEIDLPDPTAGNLAQEHDQSTNPDAPNLDDLADFGIGENAGEDTGSDGGGSGEAADHDPATPTAQDLVDLNTLAERFYGQRLTEVEATNLFRIAAELNSMTPGQIAEMQRVLSGEAPSGPAPATRPAPTAPVAPVAPHSNTDLYQNQPVPPAFQPPAATQTPTHVPLPEDYAGDPELEQWAQSVNQAVNSQLTPLQAQLAELQSTIAAQQQQQYEAQLAEYAREANGAADEWLTSHTELSPEERVLLRSQISDQMVGQYIGMGYDTKQAVNAAFDHLYWSDPALRDRYVESQIEARQAELNRGLERRRKADAVTGGGSAPRAQESANVNDDPNALRQEKVNFFAKVYNQ